MLPRFSEHCNPVWHLIPQLPLVPIELLRLSFRRRHLEIEFPGIQRAILEREKGNEWKGVVKKKRVDYEETFWAGDVGKDYGMR